MKVSIIGGTGFIGAYLVDELIERGHRPRLLVRAGSEKKLEQPGQCDTVTGDIDDPEAVRECIEGTDALIYLIGILREYPDKGITFEKAQYQGFADCLAAAQNAGVRRVVLMSANGVDSGDLPYQKTKRRAERLLESSDRDWTIFRPSVVFGDPRGRMEFCTQLKAQLVDPPLPAAVFFPGLNVLAAGAQPMSPVHVRNVAEAFAGCLDNPATHGKIFALGGPGRIDWKDVIRTIARASGKHGKLLLPAPAWGVKAVAGLMERFEWFPLTRDQVSMLMQGNAVDTREAFDLLGIEPIAFDEESLSYLARR
jgi:NADH dehydrogenase